MIRVVLTVLLAVALMAVSLPVLDDARTETTAERIETEAERIERGAADVTADSVAVGEAALAARRSLVVRAPSGFDAAPIDGLMLVDVDSERLDGERVVRADGTVIDARNGTRITSADVALTYRLHGGSLRAVPIPNPTDRIELVVDNGPIELRTAGESRIELRFVDGEKGTTVRISRVG